MENRKKPGAWAAFWLVLAAYLTFTILDSGAAWYYLFWGSGLLNTPVSDVLTLGALSRAGGRLWGDAYPYAAAFPGVLLALFPVLALALRKRGYKTAAVVLAAVNCLHAATLVAGMTVSIAFALCWTLQLLASGMLLVYTLTDGRARLCGTLTLILAALSLAASLALTCIAVKPMQEFKLTFVGLSNWARYGAGRLLFDVRRVFTKMQVTGNNLYPLSGSLLLAALGVGLLALPQRERQAAPARDAYGWSNPPMDAPGWNAPSAAPTQSAEPDYAAALEQMARLREQGLLTDEDYQRKKAEILDKL